MGTEAGPMFDPKKAQDKTDVPAGEHLVALVWFELKKSKAGNPYMRGKFEVCAGESAGKTFYASQTLTEASYGRIGVWCGCVGVTEPFDLTDPKALRAAFAFKPFKAKLKISTSGEYTNVDIERYVPKLSPAEQKAAQGWVLDQAEKAAMDGGGDNDGGEDDEIPF